jgi:hypothetical protein
MKRSVSDRARTLATELERLFDQDTELAHKLNDAHSRLRDENDRLWSGLHPGGLRAVSGDHPASEAAQLEATVHGRSEVLDTPDGLDAVQAVHWQIHQAHCDYQPIAAERRRLAAVAGEVIRAFLDEPMAAGWSEEEARTANVHELAGSPRWRRLGHDDSKLASGLIGRAGTAAQDASSGQDTEPTP